MFHRSESIDGDRSIESDLGLNFKKPVAALFVASSQRVRKLHHAREPILLQPRQFFVSAKSGEVHRSTASCALCLRNKKTVPRAKRRTVTSQMSCIESTAGAGGQIVNCLWSNRVQFERIVI